MTVHDLQPSQPTSMGGTGGRRARALESIIHAFQAGCTAEETAQQYPSLQSTTCTWSSPSTSATTNPVQDYLHTRPVEAEHVRALMKLDTILLFGNGSSPAAAVEHHHAAVGQRGEPQPIHHSRPASKKSHDRHRPAARGRARQAPMTPLSLNGQRAKTPFY